MAEGARASSTSGAIRRIRARTLRGLQDAPLRGLSVAWRGSNGWRLRLGAFLEPAEERFDEPGEDLREGRGDFSRVGLRQDLEKSAPGHSEGSGGLQTIGPRSGIDIALIPITRSGVEPAGSTLQFRLRDGNLGP